MFGVNDCRELTSGKLFSIVIPSYNRAWCIERAILSAANFLKYQDNSEIVVVDDGSTDGTLEKAKLVFEKLKNQGFNAGLVMTQHRTNLGVCAAKNTGSRFASGEWLLFLDSDDELIAESIGGIKQLLKSNLDLPLHFFCCISGYGSPASVPLNSIRRNFVEYLKHGTNGEALPVVKRCTFLRFPYDEDISGYESLSYMRIVKTYGYACIHNLVVRRYHVSHSDRLSASKNFRQRSGSLAKGHRRVLFEHFSNMGPLLIFKYTLKFLRMKFFSYFLF